MKIVKFLSLLFAGASIALGFQVIASDPSAQEGRYQVSSFSEVNDRNSFIGLVVIDTKSGEISDYYCVARGITGEALCLALENKIDKKR